jgi:cytochrome c-type biogenesis protein CcmE
MNRRRLLTIVTVLVVVAIVGGLILEAGSFPERYDTIPSRPIG